MFKWIFISILLVEGFPATFQHPDSDRPEPSTTEHGEIEETLVESDIVLGADKSADDAPATKEPADDVPATEEPADDIPATEEPVDDVPATEEPAADAPAADAPAVHEPAVKPGVVVPVKLSILPTFFKLSSSKPVAAIKEDLEKILTKEQLAANLKAKEEKEKVEEKIEQETFKKFSKTFAISVADTLSKKGTECVEVLGTCTTKEECCGDTMICKRHFCRPKTWVPIDVMD